MRVIAVLLVVAWLGAGALAAHNRHDFTGLSACSQRVTLALTIVAGASNFAGVHPSQTCA